MITVCKGLSVRLSCYNCGDGERDKCKRDDHKEQTPAELKLSFGSNRDVRASFAAVDASRKLQRNPIVDHADAELRGLLDKVHVIREPDWWYPVPDHIDQAQGDSDEWVRIEYEQRQVLVFVLLHQDRPDIAQIEQDE